jgi:2-pyrone-4,6-dicarboxylate lactonase
LLSLLSHGQFRAEAGPKQPGFQKLIGLLRHGEGRAWVKFTGTYRDRLIWGSDYPHLSFADKVGSVQLFNLLADWAPDEETRPRTLVDNPAALFGSPIFTSDFFGETPSQKTPDCNKIGT